MHATEGLRCATSGTLREENAGESRDRLSGGLKVECMETLVSVILIAPLAIEGQMREHLAYFVEDGKRGCPCGLEVISMESASRPKLSVGLRQAFHFVPQCWMHQRYQESCPMSSRTASSSGVKTRTFSSPGMRFSGLTTYQEVTS